MICSNIISVSIIRNNLKILNNIHTKNNIIKHNINININNNGNRNFFKKLFETGSGSSVEPVTKEMSKVLNYPTNQVYDVVLKVEEYEDFLPFCLGSTITKKNPNGQENCFEAELVVGQGSIKESYTSKVVYKKDSFIESTAIDTNLFHKLINRWTFKDGPKPNTCIAHCKLTYHFKSPLYASLMDSFFASSLNTMINSFDKRCEEIYKK
ncbi:hypothetical protein DICPUDRAFT_33274 [Dictyostelium purpureum]|uniref:Coenzyme Q-binding protein COQ10 START domain-containing protein n=1 Tax=Dictyostelium purpureum TaxID=5786 RepID=F0ZKK0_DICPU|nr:uncharacterized protein DICPUDRAFT_33274 [Dictyostelium purpureum]EGC35516.1 hypothetical protein DICPUDRAFT_33274 [Dictyostelium purpureum]|eukprot:XP_003287942.1 hypothetical protein DICPUDRAFT_33274 [Dictyostelium purpureum]